MNNCYLSFSPDVSLDSSPYLGARYDSALVAYWKLDDGLGSSAYDSAGYGNNATLINSVNWVDGRFNGGIGLNGAGYLRVTNSASLNISGPITFSAWINPNSIGKNGQIVSKAGADYYSGVYSLRIDYTNTLTVRLSQGGSIVSAVTSAQILSKGWYLISFTYDGASKLSIYVNGVSVSYSGGNFSGPIDQSSKPLLLGQRESNDMLFDGSIDDVRIYNRCLSSAEISSLFDMGLYAQPDPAYFVNYLNFTDSNTRQSMLIYAYSDSSESHDSASIVCTNFFSDNKLSFQSNGSVFVNIWAPLIQPVIFGNGTWNQENFTTTLAMTASTPAELNFNQYAITTYVDINSHVIPSNVTLGYGADQTFLFNCTSGYRLKVFIDGVSQGELSNYVLSNVTASHIINVTSIRVFEITAYADGDGLVIPSGSVLVGSGESQLFNFTANPGYHISKLVVDNSSQAVADFYMFNNIVKNHSITVSFDINAYDFTVLTDEHSLFLLVTPRLSMEGLNLSVLLVIQVILFMLSWMVWISAT
jgi:hypothetical protein